MTLLRISELAERSGVPSSTLRYYERIGLVEPLGRADNGYRIYDEATLDRLAFIGRAKRLGMNLDDVATLVEAWFAGECEPVQDRLHSFVTGRIGELRRQLAEDSAFERQLERILARLSEHQVVSGRCGPDCGCDTDPLEATGPGTDRRPVACSLQEGDARLRLVEWQEVLVMATSTERAVGRLRVVFDPSAELIAELARLCAAETGCCPFFRFDLDITAAATVLTIDGPAGTEGMIGRFFDLSEPADPPSPPASPATDVGYPRAGGAGRSDSSPYAGRSSRLERAEPPRAERTPTT